MSTSLFFLLKITISIGSLFFVFYYVDWALVWEVLLRVQLLWVILALLVFLLAQAFSSLRCMYIARTLGGSLDLPTSLRAHFIGLWFNQVLPTSLGGDAIKVVALKQSLGFGIALRTAILDRLSGFMFLLLAVVTTLPLYTNIFLQQPGITLALGMLSILGITTIIIAAWGAHYYQQRQRLPQFVSRLLQIFSDIWLFRKKKAFFAQCWTSLIVHLNGIATYILLGLALGVNVDFLTFLLLVPLVFLIALLPISFAGWGVREAGAVWIFGVVGMAKEVSLALSISFGFLLIIAALPGMFIFCYRSMAELRNSE